MANEQNRGTQATKDGRDRQETDVEIFRTGTHSPVGGVPITFSQADIEGIVSSYDPKTHEAPVVVGHPALDAPAYGWVKSLSILSDKIVATIGDMDPGFSDLLKARRYAKVSAAFYRRDDPSNPKQGIYSLKHVGFLGATAPAVKGLKQANFSADDAGTLVFGSLSISELEAFYQRQISRSGDEAFVEKLIGEGRILPCQKSRLLNFMEALPAAGNLEFSDPVTGDFVEQPAPVFFRNFLMSMSRLVVFGEIAGRETASPEKGATRSNLKIPAGFEVSRENSDLFERASALAEQSGVSFSEAVRRLS